ncbi:MAG: hypothetical protein EXX96DRAFT_556759 [Benjaminiella poitrasii]|nr:MAG: hypothetical protein EXX96DRAFT_556759 [Benjaminiella poitrasii]
MKVKLVLLYLLKFIILLLSLATLGCHVAQLILLNQTSGTGSWWPDYVPYTLYYVGTIFSTLSSTLSLFLNCIITLSKSLRCDCFISSINLLLFTAIITYNSLKSDMIPWTGLIETPFSANMKGYATYCTEYSNDNIAIRCWLSNGAWLGMVIVGFFWLLFLVYSILLIRQRDTTKNVYYDFKNDVPMANPRMSSSIQRLTPLPVTTNEILSSRSNQSQYDVTNYNSNALGNNIIYEYNSYTSPLTEQRISSKKNV